jgi:hypothetical protein
MKTNMGHAFSRPAFQAEELRQSSGCTHMTWSSSLSCMLCEYVLVTASVRTPATSADQSLVTECSGRHAAVAMCFG